MNDQRPENVEVEQPDQNYITSPRPGVKIAWDIPPAIIEARNTFRAELAELMVNYPNKWVAYHGSKRLGVADTEIELYQKFNPDGKLNREFLTEYIFV